MRVLGERIGAHFAVVPRTPTIDTSRSKSHEALEDQRRAAERSHAGSMSAGLRR